MLICGYRCHKQVFRDAIQATFFLVNDLATGDIKSTSQIAFIKDAKTYRLAASRAIPAYTSLSCHCGVERREAAQGGLTFHLLPGALAREAGKVVKGTTSASEGLESSSAPALRIHS